MIAEFILAAAFAEVFTLEGKLEIRHAAEVTVHRTDSPFQATKSVLPGAGFKFDKLPPGSYMVAILVPGLGEARRTVVVGPGLADDKGRVRATFTASDFNTNSSAGQKVSVRVLSLPKAARDSYQKALRCLEKRDDACAQDQMLNAVKLAPQYAEVWNHLGTMAYHRADYKLAAERFRKALEADRDLYPALVNLGGVSINLGDYDTAWQYNVNAVLREPGDALANAQLGMTYLAMDRLEFAEKYLKEAIKLDPAHFSHPQLHLAEVYFRRKQWSMAADQLEELLRLRPNIEGAERIRTEIVRLRKPEIR